MAVDAMLAGDLRQQPATPVKKATNTKKNETMKRAIIERAMSEKQRKRSQFLSIRIKNAPTIAQIETKK